jgi:hypothetical protein
MRWNWATRFLALWVATTVGSIALKALVNAALGIGPSTNVGFAAGIPFLLSQGALFAVLPVLLGKLVLYKETTWRWAILVGLVLTVTRFVDGGFAGPVYRLVDTFHDFPSIAFWQFEYSVGGISSLMVAFAAQASFIVGWRLSMGKRILRDYFYTYLVVGCFLSSAALDVTDQVLPIYQLVAKSGMGALIEHRASTLPLIAQSGFEVLLAIATSIAFVYVDYLFASRAVAPKSTPLLEEPALGSAGSVE